MTENAELFDLVEPDKELIDLGNLAQLEDWRRMLECSEATLREAVRVVGPLYADVRAWVHSHGVS